MDSSLNLSFRYRERDYVRALRAHYGSRLRLRLDFAVIVVLLALGAYLWRFADMRWLGGACLFMAVAFALLLTAAFTVIPILIFRREPKFRDDYSLTFSPQGIHFQTAHIDSHLQWSLYSRVLVDTHSYVLYHSLRQFTVIPKRVFQNREQQQAFEQLLTQNISPIVRRDQ
jgi:hypothetical protein